MRHGEVIRRPHVKLSGGYPSKNRITKYEGEEIITGIKFFKFIEVKKWYFQV